MRLAFSPIGVGLLLLAAACGGDGVDVRETPAPASVVPSTTPATGIATPQSIEPAGPAVTPVPTIVAEAEVPVPADGRTRALSELSGQAAGAVDAVDYRIGVAVLDLAEDVVYVGGDEEQFALASVSKLALAVGVLWRSELAGRELTWQERDLLASMLSESRNGPAVALWDELGAVGVEEALTAYGVSGFWMPPDEQWGDMAAAAVDVASLMHLFVAEGALREDDRKFVLSLLQSVVTEQRWGVSAGVSLTEGAETVLAIKNGWYPEDEVWRVNSVGSVSLAGETGQVVVVLSDGALDLPRGVRTVEEVAAAVNATLFPERLLVALPPFVPPADDEPASDTTVQEEIVDPPAEVAPPAPELEFVALDVTDDVLVLASGLLSSATTEESIAIWYEVPESQVEDLLAAYLGSMRGLGWSALSGPPEMMLSKQAEGRFVSVRPLGSAPGGTQVIEFRIAPVPATTVGAAAVE